MLADTAKRLAGQVALTAPTYQKAFSRQLRGQGTNCVPSKSWVRAFLKAGGLSYKKPGSNTHSTFTSRPGFLEVEFDSQVDVDHEYAAGVPEDRVYNLDETALALLPARSFGWSAAGNKSQQLQPGRALITASLAVPMALEAPIMLQLILKGKTAASLPKPTTVGAHFAMSHFAMSHRELINYLPDHIRIVYIPPQTTSYLQPCNRSIFGCWKSYVSDKANDSFAETLLSEEAGGLDEAFDFGQKHLKAATVTWSELA